MSSLLISLDLPNRRNRFYVRPRPNVQQNWSFIDHLSRSLPTERIFDLLRQSIHPESLRRHYNGESESDILKVIIKWLEVGFKMQPST